MARRQRSTDFTPDLFTTTAPTGPRHKPKTAANPSIAQGRYLLPSDLPGALTHLMDDELVALAKAVRAELHRRGLQMTDEPTKPAPQPPSIPKDGTKAVAKDTKSEAPALTQSRINAIRAAFKAGVKPTMIARQFGISQAVIRRALADKKG